MSQSQNLNELPKRPPRKKRSGNPKPSKTGSKVHKFTSTDSSKGGRQASTEVKAKAGQLGGLKARNQKEAGLASAKARVQRRREALEEADKKCEVEKTLPQDIQEALGIEINPLRIMEQMVLSAETANADKIKLLTKMVEYTHQKTATKQEIKQEVFSHEMVLDRIREGAKLLEYNTEDDVYVAPPPK